MITTTYSHAEQNLGWVLDTAVNEKAVVIERPGKVSVALIPLNGVDAADLHGLLETVHLLRSPKNARRLLTALERARSRTVAPQSLDEFKAEIGLDDA